MSPETYAWRLERKGVKHVPKAYEIKAWQKDLRIKTFKFVFTSAMAVILIFSLSGLFQKYFSHAKGYQWIQYSWDSTLNATNGDGSSIANAAANLTGWTKFWSKNSAITASDSSGIALKQYTQQTATEDGTSAHPYTGINSGTYATGGGAVQGVVRLKKPAGASCGTEGGNSECVSGFCVGVCLAPCDATMTAGQACAFGGLAYGIVTGADGKLWLDRNLGATKGAMSIGGVPVISLNSDTAGYGWLFQWGRAADGHQYTAWGGQPSPALSTTVAATTSFNSTDTVAAPNDLKFITSNFGNYDWHNPQNLSNPSNLWDGTMNNNPCPPGFHVPSNGEWTTLKSTSGITNITNALSSALHITAAGFRIYTGSLQNQGSNVCYWSSTPNSTVSYNVDIGSNGCVYPSFSQTGYRSYGYSVRCVHN